MSVAANVWQKAKHWLIPEVPKLNTRLTENEALELAQAYLLSKGGQLREPVGASVRRDETSGQLVWQICDFVGIRGGNAHLHISDATGEVLKHWVTPK